MKFLNGFLNMAAAEINFYDSESYQGDSIFPFLCFMAQLAGLVLLIVGVAKYSTAKRNWNLFYDRRDSVEMNEDKLKKDKKAGMIMMIVGAAMMIVFYIAIL